MTYKTPINQQPLRRWLAVTVWLTLVVCSLELPANPWTPAPTADEPEIADAAPTTDEPLAQGAGNYLIVPITTELQRNYYRDNESAKAFVFINAMDPVSENGALLDAAAVNIDTMMESLAPFAEGDSSATVIFSIRTRKDPPNQSAAGVLSRALASYAREAGLREGEIDFRRYTETSKYFDHWKGLVAELSEAPLQSDIDAEAGGGDKDVMVFAVHTPLSKVLYGGEFESPADCVVCIVPPIEEADVLGTIVKAVAKLTFKSKHRICFQFHSKEWNSAESIAALSELTDPGFAKDTLGFDTWALAPWNKPHFDGLKAFRESQQTPPPGKDNEH